MSLVMDIVSMENHLNLDLEMIQSEATTRGIEIKHALNGGEQRINGHYVDGYHEDSRSFRQRIESSNVDPGTICMATVCDTL